MYTCERFCLCRICNGLWIQWAPRRVTHAVSSVIISRMNMYDLVTKLVPSPDRAFGFLISTAAWYSFLEWSTRVWPLRYVEPVIHGSQSMTVNAPKNHICLLSSPCFQLLMLKFLWSFLSPLSPIIFSNMEDNSLGSAFKVCAHHFSHPEPWPWPLPSSPLLLLLNPHNLVPGLHACVSAFLWSILNKAVRMNF